MVVLVADGHCSEPALVVDLLDHPSSLARPLPRIYILELCQNLAEADATLDAPSEVGSLETAVVVRVVVKV